MFRYINIRIQETFNRRRCLEIFWTGRQSDKLKYLLYPSVSLERVCGTYLLIASGDALQRFEYVRVLNDTGGEIMAMAAEGKDTEDVIHEISIQYEMDEEDIRPGIRSFIDEMEAIGYLLPMKGE